jgi:hypothetical protein
MVAVDPDRYDDDILLPPLRTYDAVNAYEELIDVDETDADMAYDAEDTVLTYEAVEA